MAPNVTFACVVGVEVRLDDSKNRWSEMPEQWVARRWPNPRVPVLAAWGNCTPSDFVDGLVVLYQDGTMQTFLDKPVSLERMREVTRLAHDRLHSRSSGVRVAVDVAPEDLGASAGIVEFRPRRRHG
jgi:hypothetical protein